MILKIIPTDKQIDILDRAERILDFNYFKYGEINVEFLFNIIDELSSELDQLKEEVEEK